MWQLVNIALKSGQAAERHHSSWKLITSDYVWMNAFICTAMCTKLLVKGVISAPMHLFYTQPEVHEVEVIHMIVRDRSGDYRVESCSRYRNFTEQMKVLLAGETIVEIAGNPTIQVHLEVARERAARDAQ